MKKPVIGIVGRENVSKVENRPIFSIDDWYRRAVIKSRRNSFINITYSRF